jgi:hypothetical protein
MVQRRHEMNIETSISPVVGKGSGDSLSASNTEVRQDHRQSRRPRALPSKRVQHLPEAPHSQYAPVYRLAKEMIEHETQATSFRLASVGA